MRSSFAPLRAACFSLALVGLVAIAVPARAAFLIDPTGGTTLSDSLFTSAGTADPDDGSAVRSLGGSFTLYGATVNSLYLQADGFLSTADGYGYYSDRNVAALSGIVGGSIIAPYYDDLYYDTSVSNSIVEKSVAGSYYSVTYTVNGESDSTAAATAKFQTVLFTGNATINNVSFLAGDIVFSYGTAANTVQSSNFSVGVAQNATTATNAFTTGQFATNAAFFSNFNLATQGILFRRNVGGTTYTQTLTPLSITPAATPEPGTFVLVGAGALPLLGIVARRRRKTA